MQQKFAVNQLLPIVLSFITWVFLCFLLFIYLVFLNHFSAKPIAISIRPQDILVGVTIYLKTAIDFALFIGNLPSTNQGLKKRFAIELGTAFGNGIGTLLVLTIWYFFKSVPVLLGLMIFIAAIVLLVMAEEGLEKLLELNLKRGKSIQAISKPIHKLLIIINPVFHPLVKLILPEEGILNAKSLSFINLVAFSFVIPFILGLDDFAGYIPLFTLINVFGFSIGAMFAHFLLTAGLFISPGGTTKLVKNPFVLLFGSIAFVAIALYGFIEVVRILLTIF